MRVGICFPASCYDILECCAPSMFQVSSLKCLHIALYNSNELFGTFAHKGFSKTSLKEQSESNRCRALHWRTLNADTILRHSNWKILLKNKATRLNNPFAWLHFICIQMKKHLSNEQLCCCKRVLSWMLWSSSVVFLIEMKFRAIAPSI